MCDLKIRVISSTVSRTDIITINIRFLENMLLVLMHRLMMKAVKLAISRSSE